MVQANTTDLVFHALANPTRRKVLERLSAGPATVSQLAESFDIGVFTVEPGRKGYDKQSVIAVQPATVKSGQQTLRLVVDREPKVAGVDPFNKRVDRNSDDNLKAVE